MAQSSRSNLLLLLLPFALLFWLTWGSKKPATQLAATKQPAPVLVNQAEGAGLGTVSEAAGEATESGSQVLRQRIVAVADIHGDLPHLLRILRRAELVDLKGQWIGEDAVLVQTGDIVDRGKDTIALYRFFQSLRPQAERAGGAVVSLLGNHEVMNALGDWRYVTKEDIASFGGERNRREAMLTGWIGQEWRANYSITARLPYLISSFPPGVPVTTFPSTPSGSSDRRFLSEATSSSSASFDPFAYSAASFVHGGITPNYLESLETDRPIERINEIGSSILNSLLDSPSAPLSLPRNASPVQKEFWSERGPMWNRDWALEEEDEICDRVDRAMKILKVRRLIQGHTPQFEGIQSRCGGKVLLIDTGISRAYGGPLSSLEIVHTLTPPSQLTLSEALEFGIVDLADPTPEETLRVQKESGEPVKWIEREIIKALYTEGTPEVELNTISLSHLTRPPLAPTSNVEVDIKTEKDIGSTLQHVEHGTEATALLSLLTTLLQSKKVDQIKPLLALLASLGIKVEVEQLIKGVHASGELKEKLTGVVKAEGREKEIEIEKEKVSEVKTKTKASETVDTTKDAQVSRETKRETSDVRNVKDQQFEQQLRRLEDSVVVQLLLAGGFDKTLKLKILARFLAGCHEGSEGDIGKVEELSLVLLLLRLLLETERGVTYSYGSSSTLHKSLHDRLVAQGRAHLRELLDVGSYTL
ncbi:hypothetical protein JCM11641_006407 [Rhodosporidiobolus odoratus]